MAEVTLASGFPTQLAIGALLLIVGVRPWSSAGTLSLAYLASVLLIDTAVIGMFVAVTLRRRGDSLRRLLTGTRAAPREALLGAAMIPLVFGGAIALMGLLRAVWPALHNVPVNPFEAAIRTPVDAAVLGIAAVIGGGVKEEIQRAFILHRFRQHLGGARVGLVLYSLTFGMGHVMQGWDVGILTALLGVAWGIVFLWRRSAVASIVSHCGFNAAQIIQFAVFGS